MVSYWIGNNGNVYVKGNDGSVSDLGKLVRQLDGGVDAEFGSAEGKQIANPSGDKNNTNTNNNNNSGAVDRDAAERANLLARITGRGGEIQAIYDALFGDLTNLVRARDTELESQYGDQLKEATKTYTDAIPEIEGSYAAIGAADSTDQSDAKDGAKEGFDSTTNTIKKNKEKDKAALGQYKREQEAKFTADKDSANRAVQSAGETTDVGALRGFANDLDQNISTANVTRATLGTDGAARQEISNLTGDNGRYQAATNALDDVIKSSMSGAVKAAAVDAITDASGLSDQEKQKIRQQYGDVYAEQSAL